MCSECVVSVVSVVCSECSVYCSVGFPFLSFRVVVRMNSKTLYCRFLLSMIWLARFSLVSS